MNDIRDKLLEKIKAGEVNMVPKWRFVLETVLWAFGLVVAALVAVYFLSFILFILNRSGVLFAPLYGWHGVMLFIVSSPWFLIMIVGIFLLVLYLLVTHYSFSYKRPLVYSMIGVVLLVIAVSSLIHQLSVHERMERFVESHQVPGLAPMYRGFGEERPNGVVVGTITAFSEEILELETREGEAIKATLFPHSKRPPEVIFVEGDEVMIFGEREGDMIEVFGIRPAGRGYGQKRGERRLVPPPRLQNATTSTSTVQELE